MVGEIFVSMCGFAKRPGKRSSRFALCCFLVWPGGCGSKIPGTQKTLLVKERSKSSKTCGFVGFLDQNLWFCRVFRSKPVVPEEGFSF